MSGATGNKQDQARAGMLILGVGNILLSDEGAGVRTVERLQREYLFPPGVELLDGGTSGMELLGHIEHREQLLIVDAIQKDGLSPGTARRIPLTDPPAFFQQKITPHQLGLSEVLAAAVLTGSLPRTITLYGIVPQTLDTGLELSTAAKQGVDRALGLIFADLQALGIAVKKKSNLDTGNQCSN